MLVDLHATAFVQEVTSVSTMFLDFVRAIHPIHSNELGPAVCKDEEPSQGFRLPTASKLLAIGP